MKILWIKAGGLVPTDTGGKIRSFHIARELARRNEVTFFTFYPRHAGDSHHTLDRIFSRTFCLPLDLPPRLGLRDCLLFCRLIFSGHSYTMTKYYRPEVRRAMRQLLSETRFDVVLCDFIYPAGILDWGLDSAKVLFAHNVEALIWKRFSQVSANPFWKLAGYLEYRALSRAERKYAALADHLLTVSEPDRAFFARYIDPSRISAIPTGVDLDYFHPSPAAEAPGTMVFTGSMDWMPNEDGVLWFAREVLPRIRGKVPGATLAIVGRNPSSNIRSLAAADTGVQVTGRVDDIRPYLGRGSVYVVPLRSGSGTRLKIFEAMAAGKAVVSTSLGAEGLPVVHGVHVLLADDAATFAEHTARLLREPSERNRLSSSARTLVESQFGWEAVAARFEESLYGVLQSRQGRT